MKKILVLLLASIMLFTAACSSIAKNSETDETTETSLPVATSCPPGAEHEHDEEENYDVSYPVTIVDQAGREVVIEEEPQSLVSSYYITSSLFIALGIDDRMVGIESNPEKREIYGLSSPELLNLPTVGSPKEFDFESCVALEPDLVVLPTRLSDVADQLEELDINVLLVNPENEAGLIEMIDIVGTATNTLKKASELVVFINGVKDTLNTSLDSVEPVSIYLAGISDFLITASAGMYQSDMIALAGGANAGDEIDDTYWVEVSYEQVLAWNPQYIILAADSEYDVEDVMADSSLAVCDAVINGNVYKLPSDAEAWDSPVPGCILGSLWLAGVLYPDSVSEDLYNDTVEDFYETFYGFSYSSIAEA